MVKLKYALLGAILSIASFGVWADPVNINTATAEQLATGLKGIGKSKADAIVKDREKNGPFKSVDDLTRVKGVKAATVNKNRDSLTIGAPAAAAPVAAPAAAAPVAAPAAPLTGAPAGKPLQDAAPAPSAPAPAAPTAK